MTLPCAAGLSYLDQLTKQDHRKAHQFCYANHEPYALPPGATAHKPTQSTGYTDYSTASSAFSTLTAPSPWEYLSGAVFHFGTYVYEDLVHGRLDEKLRIRLFQLAFHLEDDTIAITEQIPNSPHLYDKKFLRRQRVPKTDNPAKHLTLYDLNVGQPVVIYGRQHMFYKCDDYTRATMTHMGFEVPDDLPAPVSQFAIANNANKGMVETLHRHINPDFQFAHFLKNDGKVLRFYAVHDDRQAMYGDRHCLLIHYYLGDQTMEVLKSVAGANGKPRWVPFVRRGKIPKRTHDLDKLHAGSPWPVLKTMPHPKQPIKDYHLFDQAQLPDKVEVYTEKDLGCGQSIWVFGRLLFMHDCDGYTKWYYKTHYGKIMEPIDISEPADPVPEITVPPHNGFGLQEDSVQNVYRLIPKTLVNDARKYLAIDRDPEDPIWLTFRLRALTEDPIAAERAYIMKYHLNDNSISINSPQYDWHGKFLEKKHVSKGSDQNSSLPEYIQPEDLYVGGVVQLREQCYVIAEADEATLKFMEKHPKQFPMSNMEIVMKKYQDLLRSQQDACHRLQQKFSSEAVQNGTASNELFVSTLMEITGNALTPHEYTTILRAYQIHPHIPLDTRRDVYRAFLQRAMKREMYEPKHRLLVACQKLDVSNSGYISREEMVRAGRATKIPVAGGVWEDFVELVVEDRGVPYRKEVDGLNWVRNPVIHCPVPDTMDAGFDFNRFFGLKSTTVRYKDFLRDLGCERTSVSARPF
ncbi:EF-hand domain-containing family member C2-like [Paramacrobiotus metropolitanus]|uniref:EF-hand domain-containing family member C2-like n=1 Tax=Paramacrobiotus metropolitanus TaxID=2943436 RepID=UPI0024459AEA|nr:EF-hand domain-containing family member C2-like [Paramacrobiotus metropolitanus]XP_055341814.1 EF-hand domain-containing family member C2-like [Paramacrobiotus metropolitanus]XP_055341815.1 EF-hand domain-containing family member C2-like [Paramacrobiotus metropolitanus]